MYIFVVMIICKVFKLNFESATSIKSYPKWLEKSEKFIWWKTVGTPHAEEDVKDFNTLLLLCHKALSARSLPSIEERSGEKPQKDVHGVCRAQITLHTSAHSHRRCLSLTLHSSPHWKRTIRWQRTQTDKESKTKAGLWASAYPWQLATVITQQANSTRGLKKPGTAHGLQRALRNVAVRALKTQG